MKKVYCSPSKRHSFGKASHLIKNVLTLKIKWKQQSHSNKNVSHLKKRLSVSGPPNPSKRRLFYSFIIKAKSMSKYFRYIFTGPGHDLRNAPKFNDLWLGLVLWYVVYPSTVFLRHIGLFGIDFCWWWHFPQNKTMFLWIYIAFIW